MSQLLSQYAANVLSQQCLRSPWLPPTFFGLHYWLREFGSSFNHFDAVDPEAADFGEITQNNGHYTPFEVIQGHPRFRYQRKACMRLQLVNSLHYMKNRHPRYGRLLVQFSLSTGASVFNALLWSEPAYLPCSTCLLALAKSTEVSSASRLYGESITELTFEYL